MPWSSSQRPVVACESSAVLMLVDVIDVAVVDLESPVAVVVVASICSSICFSLAIHSDATLPPLSVPSDDSKSTEELATTLLLFHLLPILLLDAIGDIVGS